MTKYAPKMQQFEDIVLLKMYECLVTNDSSYERYPYATAAEISEHFTHPIGSGYVAMAMNRLASAENIHPSKYGDTYAWTITQKGIDLVQELEDREESYVSLYLKYGDEWLFEGTRQLKKPTSPAPSEEYSQDSEWAPLPIDREDPETIDVIEGIDKALTAIKQDNGYAENHPEERDFIVQNLQSAMTWFRTEKAILVLQLKGWVIEPLERARKRFGPSVVGAAVTIAKELVVAWLKKTLIGG